MNIHRSAANSARQQRAKGLPPSRKTYIAPGAYCCPKCGRGTLVLDTRPSGNTVRRVRACVGCGHRMTTYETEREEPARIPTTAAIEQFIADLHELADKYQVTLDRLGEQR